MSHSHNFTKTSAVTSVIITTEHNAVILNNDFTKTSAVTSVIITTEHNAVILNNVHCQVSGDQVPASLIGGEKGRQPLVGGSLSRFESIHRFVLGE